MEVFGRFDHFAIGSDMFSLDNSDNWYDKNTGPTSQAKVKSMARKMSEPNCRWQKLCAKLAKESSNQWNTKWCLFKLIWKMDLRRSMLWNRWKIGITWYHLSQIHPVLRSARWPAGVTVSWCVSRLGTMKCIGFLFSRFSGGVLDFEKFSHRSLEYGYNATKPPVKRTSGTCAPRPASHNRLHCLPLGSMELSA